MKTEYTKHIFSYGSYNMRRYFTRNYVTRYASIYIYATVLYSKHHFSQGGKGWRKWRTDMLA